MDIVEIGAHRATLTFTVPNLNVASAMTVPLPPVPYLARVHVERSIRIGFSLAVIMGLASDYLAI
ncbi:hypothetical protein M413DRAFT_438832 [Hebeloma cylindrosporum]|uniref:Uncharacterized protein n=1 Tax=Hebeloma cylindrosporum TaxID=76867 RepID=A0A0C3CZU3_HEBCY|nr:hypothetical protein M413DRAFT_438832 [Hebeloma cylindrosporum h7]